MMKLNWRRALAAIVVSTMAITAVPGIVFAEEVEVESEEAVVVESDETDQAVFEEEEAVEAEEIVVEGTDEAAETDEAAVAVEPEEEENIGAGDAPTDPMNPEQITFGKQYSAQLAYEEIHYFKIVLNNPARVYFKLSSSNGVGINIVDSHDGADYSGTGCTVHWYKNSYDTKGNNEYEFSLTAPHTYFMEIFHHGDNADYSFNMTIKRPPVPSGGSNIIDPDLKGSRSDAEHAKKIDVDNKYVSMFTVNRGTTHEWYKFQVKKDNTQLYLTLNSPEISNIGFALYYNGVDVMDQVGLKQYGYVYKGNGYSNEKLVTSDVPWKTPRILETDKFPAGTYYLWILQDGGYQDSGYYNLGIGTKAGPTPKSVAIDKKKIALGIGGTEKLTEIVKPDNADEKAVIWKAKNTLVATVDDEGNVKGISEGKTEVTATSSVNKDLIATCEVYVADVVVDDTVKEDCPLNVVKEKVDVTSTQYFGRKYDKYEVADSKIGSVDKNGFFTSKKSGSTEIRGLVQAEGSLYVCAKKIKVDVKQPRVKYPKNDKGKEVKFFTATFEGDVFDAKSAIENEGAEITDWKISDTKGNFELLDNGLIRCNKNGTNTKVTPLFGADKTPGNITFTLKTVTPKLSATKKLKQQTGQNFVLKLSNCTETSEIEWKFEADPTDTRVAVQTDAVTIEEVKADKPTKLQKKININKAVSGKIVATVDGHTYECTIEVVSPEIKKSAQTLKVGKAGAVGVKNTKIKDITWTTSDSSKVEIVDAAKGKIKAVAPGTATISAEIGGVTVSCEVTVTE